MNEPNYMGVKQIFLASSLDDIANHFQKLADDARFTLKKRVKITQIDRRGLLTEIRCWEGAAHILKSTGMKP